MNRRIADRLVLVAVVAIALTASVANAQTVSNGPYYATPAWDQKLDPSVRFIILANWNSEAVLDRETGVVWQLTPSGGSVDWNTASRTECMRAKIGGRQGWRLPTVQELMSLGLHDRFVNGIGNPLALGHPFVLPANTSVIYWTATSVDDVPTSAFSVGWTVPGTTPPNFTPFLPTPTDKSANRSVWCVRGGLQPAAQ